MHVRAAREDRDARVAWAERAESACTVFGTAAAVLAFGLGVAMAWFRLWGFSPGEVEDLPLAGAIDVVLLLLAITFHRLAVDLGRD